MTTTKKPIQNVTYILNLTNGSVRKIVIPENWTVTFGPAVPPDMKSSRYDKGAWALRIYAPKKQQRAIFTDVTSFRIDSIKILEKVVETKRKVVQAQEEGGRQNYVVEAKATRWENPDIPGGESAASEQKYAQLVKMDDIEEEVF